MAGTGIPGMYFDQEANRWFALPHQQRHVVVPPAQERPPRQERLSRRAQYGDSPSATSRKRKRTAHQPLKRSPLPGQPSERSNRPATSLAGLGREIGSSRNRAQLLAYYTDAAAAYLESQPFDLGPPRDNRGAPLYPTHFAWDSTTNGALLAQTDGRMDYYLTSFCCWSPHSRDRPMHVQSPDLTVTHFHGLRPPAAFQSRITSISLSPSRVAAVTTLGDATNADVSIMPLSDPATSEYGYDSPPEFDMAVVYNQPNASVFCSRAAPTADSGALFAIGRDTGVMLYKADQQSDVRPEHICTNGAVHSLEWLNPNLVAAGLNNGRIVLWDIRSGGHAQRLLHPTMVNSLRCGDTTGRHLVVSGPLNTTATYDLRMPASHTGGWRDLRGNGRFNPKVVSRTSTPVLRFPRATSYYKTGMDVNLDLNLLAAGTEHNTLGVYSLSDGRFIREFHGKAPADYGQWARDDQCLVSETQWVKVLGDDAVMWTGNGLMQCASWPRDRAWEDEHSEEHECAHKCDHDDDDYEHDTEYTDHNHRTVASQFEEELAR